MKWNEIEVEIQKEMQVWGYPVHIFTISVWLSYKWVTENRVERSENLVWCVSEDFDNTNQNFGCRARIN